MHKQSYITKVFPLFLYFLSMSMYATNFKLKDESVRGSESLGKIKLLHNDKKGYTLFADRKKYTIQPHQCSPELRILNNKQLAAFAQAGYVSVHKQSDGEFALKSHVRGPAGMGNGKPPVFKGVIAGQVGYWATKTAIYSFAGWVFNTVTSRREDPIIYDNTVLYPSTEADYAFLDDCRKEGGLKGIGAAVAENIPAVTGQAFNLATGHAGVELSSATVSMLSSAPMQNSSIGILASAKTAPVPTFDTSLKATPINLQIPTKIAVGVGGIPGTKYAAESYMGQEACNQLSRSMNQTLGEGIIVTGAAAAAGPIATIGAVETAAAWVGGILTAIPWLP